jgi:hypothetical protein
MIKRNTEGGKEGGGKGREDGRGSLPRQKGELALTDVKWQ